MNKLFGTDGIRGIANVDLDCNLATKTALAINEVLLKEKEKPAVVVGKDTRISGGMLESAMAAAFASVGVMCHLVGIIPTPGLSFLTKSCNFSAGIMISASHNPFYYNGIKIFNYDGLKLSDSLESKIEKIIHKITKKNYEIPIKSHEEIGKIVSNFNLIQNYISHLKECSNIHNKKLNIAIDCANGSSSVTANEIFPEFTGNTEILFNKPDGININEKCGSTNLEFLKNYVKNHENIDIGIAFDGDADRCIMIDENGDIVDGDCILAICAEHLKSENKLINNCVVSTIASNIGLDDFCHERNIALKKSDVGDKNVIEKMLEVGSNLGGEVSGHTIFLDFATTGDGQLTAIQILNIIGITGKKLCELSNKFQKIPQKSINVKIDKSKFSDVERRSVIEEIVTKSKQNHPKVYVLVRESGTENLIRISVQGKDDQELAIMIAEIKEKISEILG